MRPFIPACLQALIALPVLGLGACTTTTVTVDSHIDPSEPAYMRPSNSVGISVFRHGEEISKPHKDVASLTAIVKKSAWPKGVINPEDGIEELKAQAYTLKADAIIITSRGTRCGGELCIKFERDDPLRDPQFTIVARAIQYTDRYNF